MKVAVLRPEPGNATTAARLEARGLDVIRLPLFAVAPVAWEAPDPADFDALLLTSANAVRHAGETIRALAALPVVAVGEQTAIAARGAGLNVLLVGDGDGLAALAQARALGRTRLLHLGGRDRITLPVAAAIPVYASEAIIPPAPRIAALAGTLALLHSQRAARHFARLVDGADIDRGTLSLATFSEAVAAAAGTGWRLLRHAPHPSDEALVTLAAQIVGNDRATPRVRSAEE